MYCDICTGYLDTSSTHSRSLAYSVGIYIVLYTVIHAYLLCISVSAARPQLYKHLNPSNYLIEEIGGSSTFKKRFHEQATPYIRKLIRLCSRFSRHAAGT